MNSTLGLPVAPAEAPGHFRGRGTEGHTHPIQSCSSHSYLEAQSSHTLFVSFNQVPTIFFPLLNNAAKQKDFQDSAIKCSPTFSQRNRTDKLLGTIKNRYQGPKIFFCLSCPGQRCFEMYKTISKVTQVWSCAPKTLTTGITELPINRPGSILGKSRWGFVTQHKAVTSSSMLSWPVSNNSVGKQQNFSSKTNTEQVDQ